MLLRFCSVSSTHHARHGTARALARRLTVVMTFVINLAVPPLLFSQVLNGRALYTSSVLIGLYWISIIGLLMLVYWLLYCFTARLEAANLPGGLVSPRGAGGVDRPVAGHKYDINAASRSIGEICTPLADGARYLPTGDPR